jgi:uncharacterized FlaG/YvyC family protein
MMELIPEELVEETWQEVAGFSPIRGQKEMEKLGKKQPDLLSFMLVFTEDLNPEVKELAIYMFFVVYRIFEKSSKKEIRKIPGKEVEKCYESNEKLVEKTEGIHEKFLERIAKTQVLKQPHVMNYVLTTLMEPDEVDPIDLTPEDIGYLFLLFKTAIDLLDQSV